MTRGGVQWLVRALTDWVLSVGQGQALITYRSPQARNAVIEQLQRAFLAKHLKTAMLDGMQFAPMEFVSHIFRSDEDVLFVLNADRLIFDKNKPDGPSIVNFNRERIVERSGVQIWFMWLQGEIRFTNELPDLNRFFLFREELMDEPEPVKLDWTPLDWTRIEQPRPGLGPMYLERARRAVKANASPAKIWLELGLPALREFASVGDRLGAATALSEISAFIGPPDQALSVHPQSLGLANFHKIVGDAYGESHAEKANQHYELAASILHEMAPRLRDAARTGSDAFKGALANAMILEAVICANTKLSEQAICHLSDALSLTDEPVLKAKIQDLLRQLDPTPAPADTSASPSTNPDSPAPTH